LRGAVQREIAERFDVGQPHISHILAGRCWAWLPEIEAHAP